MTTLREQIDAKIAPLLAPLAGEKPVGADPAFEPEFEQMKLEIDKLTSIAGLEPAWGDIRQLGAAMLSKRAKDLRVAGWLAAAEIKLRGWNGFAEALVTYDGIARAFWDSMYPDAKRPRGRINAFTWLAELSAKHLEPLPVSFADGDAVRASDEALKAIDQLFAEKFGEAYNGPGQLRSLMRSKLAAIPAAAVVEPPPPPRPSPAASPAASAAASAEPADGATAPSAPVATVAPSDATQAVEQSAQAMVRAAEALRTADPTRAQAYRLQRWGAWATVQNAPPADGEKTRIRPPPDPMTRRLQMLRDSQKWLELLTVAEAATGNYLFWLDLHRSVANALDRLGPTFAGAREVVGREVVAFVQRFPSVPSLTFANGTPFAEGATKTWLDEEAAKYGGSGGSAASSAASAEDEEVAKRFEAAEAMVGEGKIAEGLGVGAVLAARGADGRARFRSGLALARMAVKGSRPDVARAILERLLADVDRHDLETWEPSLCGTLYAALLSAMRDGARAKAASPEAAEATKREQAIFDKLCRVDPAAALKFVSG
jgi:type VI secretion system protein VasJ